MAGFELPWFKVYAAEALSDENFSDWTMEERGAWLTLLCHQWREGSIPASPDKIARLLRMDTDAMRPQCDRIWRRIADRFVPHPDLKGRLASPRMEMEREEAIAQAAKKSEAGKKAATSRWAKENRKAASDETAETQGCDRNATAMRTHASQIQIQSQERADQIQPASTYPINGEGAADPLRLAGDDKRLMVFREDLGRALGLPGPVAIGNDADAVVTFIQSQREAVGDETLMADCLAIAKKSKAGTPASLAFFVGWLRNLPVPNQGKGAA